MPGDPAERDLAAFASPSLLPVTATLLALAGVRDGETVVDAGCGAGLLTHPSAAAVGETGVAYGVDPDAELLAYARARRDSRARWVVGDPARLPFAGESAHKVLCGAAGAVADLPAALVEWCRVLEPGGRIVLAAWNRTVDLPVLLVAAGLRVQHASTERAPLTFPSPAAYAAWRAWSGATGAVPPGNGPAVVAAHVGYASAIRT